MKNAPPIPRPWNTKEKGWVEFLVYQDNQENKFIGVCLTFDIVEEGTDPKSLMQDLEEAAKLHIKVVIEKNLPDDLLNRYAPNEYWDKYLAVQSRLLLQEELKKSLITNAVASTATTVYPNHIFPRHREVAMQP